MIRAALIASLCGPVLAGAPHGDLLRFTDGDQIHGAFLGMRPGPLAVWQRDDVSAPLEFKTERIRHIVLRGAKPQPAAGPLSHAVLVNGDRIPGTISELDATVLTLDTACAGQLGVPRAQLAMLAVHPLGGRMSYHGPFAADEWQQKQSAMPADMPVAATDSAIDGEAGAWEFTGAAWQWSGGAPGSALIRPDAMPEKSLLRFELAWKNRLGLTLALHADFAPVHEPEEQDKPRAQQARFTRSDAAEMPRFFGNSQVLQIHSNYLLLFRSVVDKDGKPSFKRVQHHGNPLRLGESGRARIELRSDRRSGTVTLFVNDEFAAQWGENADGALPAEAAADDSGQPGGAGIGFLVHADNAPVRISDIMLAEWNGMPDSARSMQADEHDIVLMNNGTDRYAGRVEALDAAGRILFEGKHGRFQFPLDDVAEIRFARQRLAAAPEAPAGQIAVRFTPIGRISGKPLAGDGRQLSLLSPLLGEIGLKLDSAAMIEFNSSNLLIDDWDASF